MSQPASLPHSDTLKTRLVAYERRLIEDALRATAYHQRHAAAALGLQPSTLCEKMKRLGIPSRQRMLEALAASGGAGVFQAS